MNALLTTNQPLTMTTQEIALLLEKNHSDIKRSAKRLSDNGILTQPLAEYEFSHKGNTYTGYKLIKRDCLVLVAQNSPEFTAAIVDRWQELEAQEQPQFQIPQTLPEALQLAADLAKEIEENKPKIAVYEQLADRKGDVSTTVIAKQLGVSAIKLNKFLREHGVKWQKADLPKAGFDHWFNVVADVKNDHEFTQCLITPEGQIEITKLWNKSLTNKGE